MAPNEEAMKIAGAFAKYAENRDKSLIENIPEDKLEMAFIQYAREKHLPFYSAMEMRLKELKEEKSSKRTTKEKWKDRLIGSAFTIVAGLILACLKGWFKL